MQGGKYFTLIVLLFLNLFVILKLGLRINFTGEIIVLILSLIMSLVILTRIYNEMPHGVFLSLFFLLSLINLYYIKHAFAVNATVNVGLKGWLLFGVTFFLTAIGFLIGVFSIEKREEEELIEPTEPTFEEIEKKIKC